MEKASGDTIWRGGGRDAAEAVMPRLLEFVRVTRRGPGGGADGNRLRTWAVDYHAGDSGEFSLDGRCWRPRERGTVHLYAPGTRHWERSTAADVPFVETFFLFDGSDSPDLQALVRAGEGFARFRNAADRVGPILDAGLGSSGGEKLYWRAQAALLRVLDVLVGARHVEGSEYDVEAAEARGGGLAERVDRILLARYHEKLSLRDVARAAGVSRSLLTHRYRREAGMTPMARLMEIRLNRARAMILRGERLKVAAAAAGFYDEYHLSKAFKRRYGQSPRRYLRGAGCR